MAFVCKLGPVDTRGVARRASLKDAILHEDSGCSAALHLERRSVEEANFLS